MKWMNKYLKKRMIKVAYQLKLKICCKNKSFLLFKMLKILLFSISNWVVIMEVTVSSNNKIDLNEDLNHRNLRFQHNII